MAKENEEMPDAYDENVIDPRSLSQTDDDEKKRNETRSNDNNNRPMIGGQIQR